MHVVSNVIPYLLSRFMVTENCTYCDNTRPAPSHFIDERTSNSLSTRINISQCNLNCTLGFKMAGLNDSGIEWILIEDLQHNKVCKHCCQPLTVKQLNLTEACRMCFNEKCCIPFTDIPEVEYIHRSYKDMEYSLGGVSGVSTSPVSFQEEMQSINNFFHEIENMVSHKVIEKFKNELSMLTSNSLKSGESLVTIAHQKPSHQQVTEGSDLDPENEDFKLEDLRFPSDEHLNISDLANSILGDLNIDDVTCNDEQCPQPPENIHCSSVHFLQNESVFSAGFDNSCINLQANNMDEALLAVSNVPVSTCNQNSSVKYDSKDQGLLSSSDFDDILASVSMNQENISEVLKVESSGILTTWFDTVVQCTDNLLLPGACSNPGPADDGMQIKNDEHLPSMLSKSEGTCADGNSVENQKKNTEQITDDKHLSSVSEENCTDSNPVENEETDSLQITNNKHLPNRLLECEENCPDSNPVENEEKNGMQTICDTHLPSALSEIKGKCQDINQVENEEKDSMQITNDQYLPNILSECEENCPDSKPVENEEKNSMQTANEKHLRNILSESKEKCLETNPVENEDEDSMQITIDKHLPNMLSDSEKKCLYSNLVQNQENEALRKPEEESSLDTFDDIPSFNAGGGRLVKCYRPNRKRQQIYKAERIEKSNKVPHSTLATLVEDINLVGSLCTESEIIALSHPVDEEDVIKEEDPYELFSNVSPDIYRCCSISPPPSDDRTISPPPTDDRTIPSPPTDDRTLSPPPTDDRTIPSPPTDDRTISPPPTDDRTIPSPPTDDRTISPPPTDDQTISPPPTDDRTIPSPPTDARTISPPPTDDRIISPPPTDVQTANPASESVDSIPFKRHWGSHRSFVKKEKRVVAVEKSVGYLDDGTATQERISADKNEEIVADKRETLEEVFVGNCKGESATQKNGRRNGNSSKCQLEEKTIQKKRNPSVSPKKQRNSRKSKKDLNEQCFSLKTNDLKLKPFLGFSELKSFQGAKSSVKSQEVKNDRKKAPKIMKAVMKEKNSSHVGDEIEKAIVGVQLSSKPQSSNWEDIFNNILK